MFKCRISGVRKKKWELKEKLRKKRSKVFAVEILLSSCSLVGLFFCLNLQVGVTGKKVSKCFPGGCLKLKLRFVGKKVKLVGRHVD